MSGCTRASRSNLHIGPEKARCAGTAIRVTGVRSSPQDSGSNRLPICAIDSGGDSGRFSGEATGTDTTGTAAGAGTRSASRLVVTARSDATRGTRGACTEPRSVASAVPRSRLVVTARSNATPVRAQQRMSRWRARVAGRFTRLWRSRRRPGLAFSSCCRGTGCLENESAISFMKPFHRFLAKYGQRAVVPRGILWPVRTHLAKSHRFSHKAHPEPPGIGEHRKWGNVLFWFLEGRAFTPIPRSGPTRPFVKCLPRPSRGGHERGPPI